MDAVKTCLRKYFIFHGRAQRSEYWWFYLFTIIAGIFAAIIDGSTIGWGNSNQGPVRLITNLALLIPSVSAAWRRLHDTGRSGWWIGGGILAIVAIFVILITVSILFSNDDTSEMFIGFLAIAFFLGFIVYAITLLVFLCQDSYPGDNVYGRSTKYDTGSSVFD